MLILCILFAIGLASFSYIPKLLLQFCFYDMLHLYFSIFLLLPIYDFEETQYHDLTIMAQDYEIGTVLDALHLFYNRYILTKLYDAKKGPGSLVRSIIRELIQNPQIA